MTSRRPRTLVLHNEIAPYRLPVFEALARECDLTVYFCQERAPGRRWSSATGSFSFRHAVLPSRLMSLGRFGSLVWNPGLARRLREAGPFDVYLAGENLQNALSVRTVLAAARRQQAPFVLWSGQVEGERAQSHRGRVGRWLVEAHRQALYRSSDGFLAYGSAAREFLLRRGVPRERISCGAQVVPSDPPLPVQPTKEALGYGRKLVVLSLGYLTPRKGLDSLIQAFREVAHPDALLVIAGAGESLASLRALAGGSEAIVFPGYLEGPAKAMHFALADVFVLPTLHDPWGLVVNEAMAYGLPVVVSERAGCARDLVRDNGIVVPAGDVSSLREALRRLLGEPALRRAMGERSRAIIRAYDVPRARDDILRALRRARVGVP